ncbi:MAG: site-specific integrase, partial [Bacteroidales bacterium]
MRRVTFTIQFFIRTSRLLRNGEASISLRITVQNLRAEQAINRSVNPDQWDPIRGQSVAKTADGRALNHYLEHIRNRVYDAQVALENRREQVTAESLRDEVFGLRQDTSGILAYYQKHNDEMRPLVDKEFSKSTYTRHITSRKLVGLYIKDRYDKPDLDLRLITADFIRGYQAYLRTERNCNHNSTVKYTKNVGKLIRRAIAEGMIDKDPFLGMKFKLDPVETEVLSAEELSDLAAKDFQNERLNQVRDVFLFCCYTGLAFIDAKELRREELVLRADGTLWIKKRRSKTKNEFMVPLLKVPLAILKKYEAIGLDGQGPVLPVLSNQKYNAYLKEITDLCNIPKRLTTHVARHTFATTVTLTNGISL